MALAAKRLLLEMFLVSQRVHGSEIKEGKKRTTQIDIHERMSLFCVIGCEKRQKKKQRVECV